MSTESSQELTMKLQLYYIQHAQITQLLSKAKEGASTDTESKREREREEKINEYEKNLSGMNALIDLYKKLLDDVCIESDYFSHHVLLQ